MDSLISVAAQENLIREYRDAALIVDPEQRIAAVGALAASSAEHVLPQRQPNPYAVAQLLNMITESRPRERCISFVR